MMFYLQLLEAIKEEDFYKTNDILLQIKQQDDSIEYVEELLKFMENNPNIDYGMPGPIVHYMERDCMKGYDNLLYSSVKRKPTIHTLWMLNRLINSPELINKKKYINLLESISVNPIETEMIRNEALFYLQYQKNHSV
ncbi:MAG: hypothetical protein K6G26_08870 [Lachnospiraceae bacterium]|nr:hypothetical protein [Lachnospiraceae bacterium]